MYGQSEKQQTWPTVPPSLHHDPHDSFEMDDVKKAAFISTAENTSSPGGVTPYLGLRARLSQVWFNRWTVLLLLVLCRMLILLGGLNDNLDDAKAKALSACTKVEDIGSTMASMPHYLSVGVNDLAAHGITTAVSAMVDVLMLILTAIEELIFFIINMYIGTYACLAAAFIHGGLDVSVKVTQGATDFINGAIGDITNDMTKFVGTAQSVVNDLENDITKVGSLFGANPTLPNLDISSFVTKLKGIHVNDTAFIGDLVKLNTTIPTFKEAQQAAHDALGLPFDTVKQLVKNAYGNYSFDASIFPVANKEALTFCSDNTGIQDFFTGLYEVAATAKTVAIVVLIILAVLAMGVMAFWEIHRYRRQQKRAALLANNGFDGMDVVYISSRPLTASVGIKLSSYFRGRRQLYVRWFIAYGTSLPAIFIISLSLAGFFSCFCQWVVLHAVEKEAPALENQVGDFAGKVVTSLENVSTSWANEANGVILGMQNDMNKDVFGWVVTATSAINDTLNTFDAEMNKGLNDVFGNTILAVPIREIVQCLIGNKIDAVETGLTWVHDNAHVTFPTFNNNTFSAGASGSIGSDSDLTNFLASPSSVTTDEISGALEHVITLLRNSITQEALIATGLLLVYIIIILVGILRSLTGMAGHERVRGDNNGGSGGGAKYYTGEGRTTRSPRSSNFAAHTTARFPDFDSRDEAPETAAADDRYARHVRDEKLAAATTVTSIRSNQKSSGATNVASPAYRPGHWRSSSHGHVEDGREF